MKLMILGSANAQLNAIKRAQFMGHHVIASDYNETSVGKAISDDSWLASTFDFSETLKGALEKSIDGIMVTGTDQPVLTVSKVAEKLHLPKFLTTSVARSVTNKEVMKLKFKESNIPTPDFVFYKPGMEDSLRDISFPAVIKPLDSQGQRGIFLVQSPEEVVELFSRVIPYSREEKIIVEEYYPNDEITISGWVHEGVLKILTITDRVTFKRNDRLGICLSHEFPSKHFHNYGDDIQSLSEKIVQCFKIESGPIYFQFLIGDDGIKVNEIACRIGGAYEDEFIPYLTGVDILKMNIQGSLGIPLSTEDLRAHDIKSLKKYLSVQLFFCSEGTITNIPSPASLKTLPGVINVGFNYRKGDKIPKISNATQRIGYAIISGSSQENLEANLVNLYKHLKVIDSNGSNIIIHRKLR